jgi:orotate phosphoribosyltransferase
MLTTEQARFELLDLLREKSVFHGDFVLSSGAKSKYYVDCKETTFDPKGAWLVGQVMHSLIRQYEPEVGMSVDAVGGLTMGADPIALSVGMFSVFANDRRPLQVFTVRKTPKSHGQLKLIEGNFHRGDRVVVIDDVVTRGDSTIKAIEAVEHEGGIVAFVAVLVDRHEGGRQKIEGMGYRVISAFEREEILREDVKSHHETDCIPA